MLRTCTALSVFGLLALVFAIGLNSGNGALSSLLPGRIDFAPMMSTTTGKPLTLDIVQKDIIWHQETAQRLRNLD